MTGDARLGNEHSATANPQEDTHTANPKNETTASTTARRRTAFSIQYLSMECAECRSLAAELNRMERRHSIAREALQSSARIHAAEFLRLKVTLTEAHLNVEMATQQIELHRLFHGSPVLKSRYAVG